MEQSKTSASRDKNKSLVKAFDGNCIKCSQKIRVSSLEEIEAGDHVVFHRFAYEHHGIVASKYGNFFRIIEASKADIKSGVKKISIQDNCRDFEKCRDNISVVHYSKRYSKLETIARATEKCNEYKDTETNEKYKYHLFLNNCEHFATYCATGRECSMQVNKMEKNTSFKLLIKYVTAKMLGLDSFHYDEKLFKNLICDDCFALIKSILRVDRIPIRKKEDIEKGDIIRHEKLQDAIVLEVIERKDLHVRCLISYIGSSGGKIVSTLKKIEWNGQYCKLNYTSPTYDVYEPDEVVQRAFRIIDQNLSRNPEDFAKWCKLRYKLETWSPSLKS